MPHFAILTNFDPLLTENISLQLPVEIEAHIAQFCTHDTLTRLSRVSRSWSQSSEPSLYQQVRATWDQLPLPRADSSMRLLWQLAQNPRRAALVRTLDASRVRYPEHWQQANCVRCKHVRPGPCSSTTTPYPNSLLGDMIGPNTTDRTHPPDADLRIWAAASRRITSCLCADTDNRLVFWSNLYLALKACTNLRAILLPPGEAVCGLTASLVRLLRDRVDERFNVLQVAPAILLPPTTGIWGTPASTIDFAPVVERMSSNTVSTHLRILVIDNMLVYRTADLSRLELLAKYSISVVVNSPPSQETIYLVPALYDGEQSSKSMDQYFKDVGVYLDWRQDIEFKNGTIRYQRVTVVFHTSQVQRGIDLLVQALLRAGSHCAQLSIQVGNTHHSRHIGRKQISNGTSMTPGAVLHALSPLNWLEAVAVQDAEDSIVFPFTTEQFVAEARVAGLPRRVRVRVDPRT